MGQVRLFPLRSFVNLKQILQTLIYTDLALGNSSRNKWEKIPRSMNMKQKCYEKYQAKTPGKNTRKKTPGKTHARTRELLQEKYLERSSKSSTRTSATETIQIKELI